MARGLKFRIKVGEGLYYPYGENKDADQLHGKLICVFVFAFAKIRFSHGEAQIFCKYFRSTSSVSLVGFESWSVVGWLI